MTAAAVAVIEEAARLGVSLRVRSDRFVARPRSAVRAEFAKALDQNRAEVLKLLALAVPPPSVPCWGCRSRRYFARPERLTWICARCHPPGGPAEMVWDEIAGESRDE